MSKSPKKINRREFIQVTGLAATSLLASQVNSSPGDSTQLRNQKFRAPAGRPVHPWWVRSVSEPTIEIDWARMTRFDARNVVTGQGFENYVGKQEAERLSKIRTDNEKKQILKNIPGYTLKDYALSAAQKNAATGRRHFLGLQQTLSPQERGVPKWEGSPEEASRILRVAMRHLGAAKVGFVDLNERTRKLFYGYDTDGKQIAFENVEQAYETPIKRVIPYRAKWVIVYSVQMSTETIKRAPTITSEQTTFLSYSRGLDIQNQTQEFLHGLGYQCLGEATFNGLAIAPALGVMAGLGEMSRLNRLVTPEYGPMVRIFKLVTDLPLAIDQPIDAGIMEFCKHCKKCAESCPAGALSFEDNPTWEVRGAWNLPGHKAYFEDSVKCYTYWLEQAGSNCSICFAVCPFSKKDKAWIHKIVKAGIALSPSLDGFIRSMDDAFSYGAQKDPEAWWHLDLPEYGIDTERSVEDE